MKVCTDASLFGAVIDAEGASSILDIGTGTGVLSLMVAQKNPTAYITAVEIDPDAARQAEENFAASPWAGNFRLICRDVNGYAQTTPDQFDLIISNPPFFERNLKGQKRSKNMARHDESLNFKQLAGIVRSLLSAEGKFWVLLPAFEFNKLTGLLAPELEPAKEWSVYDRPGAPVSRKIGVFGRNTDAKAPAGLCIKNTDGAYSEEFTRLLKDYYLIF